MRPSGPTTKVMDRLARSWPDLLIGIALVSVIAMIVATLLSGESLVPLVRRDGPAEVPVMTPTDTTRVNSNPTGTAATPAADKTGTGAAPTSDDYPGSYNVFVPNVPGQPAASVEGGANTDSGSLRATAPYAKTQHSGSVAKTAEQPPSAASAASGFRVAAGALLSRDSASTVAQNYRADGYEVVVEKQDAFYLLWVGPYATQADANVAAKRISTDGGDELVYTYGGDDSNTDAADTVDATTPVDAATAGSVTQPLTPDSESPGANEVGNEAATTTANAGTGAIAVGAGNVAPIAIGTGQRYLQVGAFAFDESDRPLRAQLERLGLSVTSDEDANGLMRLYVGPFGVLQLTQTRTRLKAQGIDSFPVVP